MNNYDVNACKKGFNALCEEADETNLVSSEDCQYWVYERGYQAAMQDIMQVINAGSLIKTQFESENQDRATMVDQPRQIFH